MEVKSRLEAFSTDDMRGLWEFHKSIESRLEQLTDESQVLKLLHIAPKLLSINSKDVEHIQLTLAPTHSRMSYIIYIGFGLLQTSFKASL